VTDPGPTSGASGPGATESPRADVGGGCVSALLVGLTLGLVAAAILARSWDDCHAAGSPFNEFAAVFDGLVVFVLAGLAYTLASRLGTGKRWQHSHVQGILLAVFTAYGLLAFMLPRSVSGALYAANGAGICPGNVAPWWPGWLPI
jgi:hypothetical protein